MRKMKWLRKMVSVLLVTGMLLTLLPTGAWASDIGDWNDQETTPTPEGSWTDENNYDISWYTSATEGSTTFELKDAADLAGLAAITAGKATNRDGETIQEKFSGKTVQLADGVTIDLYGKEWSMISGFKGTFDGNSDGGASITNLTMTSADNRSGGLFASISEKIENVEVTNAYIKISTLKNNTRVGGIVASATSGTPTINNCSFEGTIIVQPDSSVISDENGVGGIVAEAEDALVSNCAFSGIIQSEAQATGGIIGLNANTNVTRCENKGTVNSDRNLGYVGGIVGQDKTSSTISTCTNNGDVTGGQSSDVGGIIGLMYGCSISECSSKPEASVEGNSAGFLGGIAGRVLSNSAGSNAKITGCVNNGSVTSFENSSGTGVGGILGGIYSNGFSVSGNVTIETCSNTGAITGQDKNGATAGGILGHHKDISTALTLKQCYNTGTVASTQKTGTSDVAGIGGIIGSLGTNATSRMEDCYNTGAIKASELDVPAGGLLGRLYVLNSSATGKSDFSIKNAYNIGSITGKTTGGIYGALSDDANPTLENCSYWDSCGASGPGDIKTSNAMTDDEDWSENLGLDQSIWTKVSNSGTTGSLPVLSDNKQEPAPTLTRVKEDQAMLTIHSPLTNDEVLVDRQQTIQLTTSGGSTAGPVTWEITSGEDIASVDAQGVIILKEGAVGRVDVTATMAGNDAYNDAVANYSFRVVSEAIDEVVIQNLIAPAIGETVSNNIDVPAAANYKPMTALGGNEVSWYEISSDPTQLAGNKFEIGKQYQASLCLKADEHFYYASNVNVVLEGIQSDAVKIESSISGDNLIILITFDLTTHTHAWSETWSGDATHHWHACENADCPMIGNKYACHTDSDSDGICDICEQTVGYTIAFDANGGTCDTTAMQTTLDSTLSTLPTPTRDGYTFRGWFTATSGGEQVTTATVFIQNATIYAQWEKIPDPPYNGKYSYEIVTDVGDNGTIDVDRYATEGDKVTITVSPDEAYLLDALTVTSGGKDVELTDNGDGTYTFTMPSGDVAITATFAEDPNWEEPSTDVSELFNDVPANHWAQAAIQYVYDNGLMTGVSDTAFAPEATTTRAMIVSMLARMENVTSAADAGFADVAADDWYATAVNWAAANGIVNGVSDDTFAPNDPITREQLAAMLMNYAEYKGIDTSARADLDGYTDQPSAWASEAVQWAVAEGLLAGVTDVQLQPQGQATRAQVAAIMQRFLEA